MNFFWPVYKNLETEFSSLMYVIHIDDHQLGVYSSKIADLVLRAVVEIESLSKELYSRNGGLKTGDIRYDDVAIKFLEQQWHLSKKVVIISSANCFLSTRELFPFVKNETKTGKTALTFSWNNAYQNIKHDRAKSQKFGSIKYLFDAMAALYLLNLYFFDNTFELKSDSKGVSLSPNLGSDIFSIQISLLKGFDKDLKPIKNDNFDRSVYFIQATQQSVHEWNNSVIALNQKINELAFQNPKVLAYLQSVNPTVNLASIEDGWLYHAFEDKNEYMDIMKRAMKLSPLNGNLEYEAVLNRHQI